MRIFWKKAILLSILITYFFLFSDVRTISDTVGTQINIDASSKAIYNEEESHTEIRKSDTYITEYTPITLMTEEMYDKLTFRKYQEDFSEENVRILYEDYYKESPKIFKASATLYGTDWMSCVELSTFGGWMRQQMGRGFVLIGSGMYGYHDSLKDELELFMESSYYYRPKEDYTNVLLSKQASPLYFYFADKGVYGRPVPVPVPYEKLNDRQKRVYDITSLSVRKIKEKFIVSIEEQKNMSPAEALESGKYVGFVSTKSPNDFGRRFLIYKETDEGKEFVGVVLVTGMAKGGDWTGIGGRTSDVFRFDYFPLIIRETDGYHWGFDFPENLYNYFGGNGGPAVGIIAIDPDP